MAIPVIIPQAAIAIHQIATIGKTRRADTFITPSLSMQHSLKMNKQNWTFNDKCLESKTR